MDDAIFERRFRSGDQRSFSPQHISSIVIHLGDDC